MRNWNKCTVAPRSPVLMGTPGPQRVQSEPESTRSSCCPRAVPRQRATSPRCYHLLELARRLQLPAGPAPTARPRPSRAPAPPPSGLRTGRGGGRDRGRGVCGGRDPARRVKPRWRLVRDPDAGGRGVSHDRRSPPL